ncbi:hypothetical protein K432DRAFT_405757 [Lepidopterella palustris CBS 459.81]|uniref:Uncharacterized protein n=1 Tax=Lepidopterella palustris CBS 459.81 TaxID=1314670 RepID=A0A8E2E8J0_9PEZI|nr:hypothetical protein K432DRAFT_405757 [Lepidopterella palustris CBS 459.81]
MCNVSAYASIDLMETFSAEKRLAAPETFRRDPSISAIPMTIPCTSVGLDMTAASRAYIMEPQWTSMELHGRKSNVLLGFITWVRRKRL